MKQVKKTVQKKEEKVEMTVLKGMRQIPLKVHDKNPNMTTEALFELCLLFNPKIAYPDNVDLQQWGLTTSEMRERKELRELLATKPKGSISIKESMASHIYEICDLIKWNIEDDFILDFQNSLK